MINNKYSCSGPLVFKSGSCRLIACYDSKAVSNIYLFQTFCKLSLKTFYRAKIDDKQEVQLQWTPGI